MDRGEVVKARRRQHLTMNAQPAGSVTVINVKLIIQNIILTAACFFCQQIQEKRVFIQCLIQNSQKRLHIFLRI